MSTKSKKRRYVPQESNQEDRIMRALHKMKHIDLQKACISRGMPSEEMVNSNHHTLISWFSRNFDRTEDPNLLAIHDKWVEDQMVLRGHTPGKQFLHPALKFAISGDLEKVDRVIETKPQGANEVPDQGKKPRAEVDEKLNVRKGTKKHMTYDMAVSGKPIEEIIEAVTKQFPDAQVKSIKIWAKRALKEKNG